MLKIAVCDDDIALCKKLYSQIKEIEKEESERIDIDLFTTGVSLWEKLERTTPYDAIFLDIELGDMTGVDIGTLIRDTLNDNVTQIIYISSSVVHAMKLFKLRPMDFLIKPISKISVKQAIMKLKAVLNSETAIVVSVNDRTVKKIPANSIVYLSSFDKISELHTKNAVYEVRKRMAEIEEKLPKSFVRIHKSYIVNYHYIKEFKGTTLVLVNGETVPVSKTYRKSLKLFLLGME